MNTQTHKKPQRKTKKPFKQEEKPAIVPRHIGVKFMAIKGVTDVKPYMSTEQEIEIIVVPNESYNLELQNKILRVEREIRNDLKPRRQRFFASISW